MPCTSAVRRADLGGAPGRLRINRVRGRLALAASVLLLVAVATVTPVRALMVEGWGALKLLVAGQTDESVAFGEAVVSADRAAVSFTPSAADLNVTFTRWQAGGTVTITATDETAATAAVIGGGDEELVLVPAGLRIVNAEPSTASYRFSVPLTIHRVTLRVGNVEVGQYEVAEAGPSGWTFDLSLSTRR